LHETAPYKNQQAVMECGCDKKAVERREGINFLKRRNVQKVDAQSSSDAP
jgi:hypothetical protein